MAGGKNAMHEIYKRILKTKNNDFSAKYCCVLTILWKNGHINTFYGEIEGQIVWYRQEEIMDLVMILFLCQAVKIKHLVS